MSSETVRLGITMGDPSGIGPELIAKVLREPKLYSDVEFLVIGDERILEMGKRIAGVGIDVPAVDGPNDPSITVGHPVLLRLPGCGPDEFPMGEVSRVAGKVAFDALSHALSLSRSGQLDGFVFGPLNKEAMHLGGNPYRSELEFFQAVFELNDVENELNYLDGVWTTRVTSHIALSQVCALITRDRVLATIQFMNSVLRDNGHDRPRIAVAALNPHAGEHGLFGREELDEILPAIELARAQGISADGPFPADTVFNRVRKERYNGLVSMYHDQGQIAMKLVGFERGVTVAGGLPVPIATPAHGTAHDIAGRGVADIGATAEAIRIACNMIRNKKATAARVSS